jgi:hypothetical protein
MVVKISLMCQTKVTDNRQFVMWKSLWTIARPEAAASGDCRARGVAVRPRRP